MSFSPEELLFAAASSFEHAEERRAFLDLACGENQHLRARLDEMFAVSEEAATFFEFRPDVQAPTVPGEGSEEDSVDGVWACIGRYRLVSRIGAGGCGVVYYAEQEEPVRRKVALKIVKLGMDTDAVIGRFELERQALARMDHANIARVLDAGATPSGRPYFVMELVEGKKITDFCDEHRLDIPKRLELFVQVCHAIQHAHQKGVIHRDIKPSNVLVAVQDGASVPKVIDFGIAKATSTAGLSDRTFTQLDQFLGTPAYMSPEQVDGNCDVDTRTDIYSLGVLLFELLTGRLPFDLPRVTPSEPEAVWRNIRSAEPVLPSESVKRVGAKERAVLAAHRGTSGVDLASRLAGDLDWIVMKATDPERSRRYDTATGLAADVMRHLKDEIVTARPPSRVDRLAKLIRRNKLVFTGGAIAVFGLMAGFGTSTWMYFRERAAREEQSRLRQVAEYGTYLSEAAVKVKYGEMEGADQLLAKVPVEQVPASLEAAQVFSRVASWHVNAGRITKAAMRFRAMSQAFASIDRSDLADVSFEILPAASAIAYSEDTQAYQQFRRMALDRFGTTTNAQVAEHVLKACLLLPAPENSLHSIAPLAHKLERALTGKAESSVKPKFSAHWASFSLLLWYYRTGDLSHARIWSERFPRSERPRWAGLVSPQIVRAMIAVKSGQKEDAQTILAPAREAVHAAFADDSWRNNPRVGYWFDWINAALLLSEAERMLESGDENAGR